MAKTRRETVSYNKTVLDNGLRIISEQVPGIESIALGICINAGSRDEDLLLPGVAHFMEHAAFRSSIKRSSKQIATQFESMGAYTNAFTTKEITCFYVRALKQNLKKSFNLLAELVSYPKFVPNEIEKEGYIIEEEIKSYDDDPEEFIFDIGDSMLFPDHPLGNPIVGTLDSIEKIKTNELRSFHENYYHPSNMVISLAGNVKHEEIVELATQFFKEFNKKEIISNRKPAIIAPRQSIIQTKGIQQAHLLLGRRSEGIRSEERYPLALLNTLLGEGMSSRLYQNMREKHGIAYSIYSTIQSYNDCGAFFIYLATDIKNIAKSKKLLFEEMNKITGKGISVPEFKRAKEQLKSSTIMELESMSVRMQSLCKSEINFGTYESTESTLNAIDSVSIDQVVDTAAKYLDCDKWSIAELLPEKE